MSEWTTDSEHEGARVARSTGQIGVGAGLGYLGAKLVGWETDPEAVLGLAAAATWLVAVAQNVIEWRVGRRLLG